MKKLFRGRALQKPSYPTCEAAGLKGRSIAAAGALSLLAGAACDFGTHSGVLPAPDIVDAGHDAGREPIINDSEGIFPTDAGLDAGVDFAVDSGGVAPSPDAGEE